LKRDNKVYLRFYFNEDSINNVDGVVNSLKFSLAYNTSGYSYKDDDNIESVFDSIFLYKEQSAGGNLINLKKPVNADAIAADSSIEPTYVLEFREDRPAAMQFVQIRYAVSTTKYEPAGDGFTELTFSEVLPINCGSAGAKKTESDEYICEACAENKCGVIEMNETLAGILEPNPNTENGGYLVKLEDETDAGGNVTKAGYDGFYVYVELAPLLDAFGMQENILDYFVPAYMLFDIKLDVEIR
jgi:hypothetical protein